MTFVVAIKDNYKIKCITNMEKVYHLGREINIDWKIGKFSIKRTLGEEYKMVCLNTAEMEETCCRKSKK